jgi:hypothetical protein
MCTETNSLTTEELTPVLLNRSTKSGQKFIVFFKDAYHHATFRPTVKRGKRQMTFVIDCTGYKSILDQAYRLK